MNRTIDKINRLQFYKIAIYIIVCAAYLIVNYRDDRARNLLMAFIIVTGIILIPVLLGVIIFYISIGNSYKKKFKNK